MRRYYANAQLSSHKSNLKLQQREAQIIAVSLTDPLNGSGRRPRPIASHRCPIRSRPALVWPNWLQARRLTPSCLVSTKRAILPSGRGAIASWRDDIHRGDEADLALYKAETDGHNCNWFVMPEIDSARGLVRRAFLDAAQVYAASSREEPRNTTFHND